MRAYSKRISSADFLSSKHLSTLAYISGIIISIVIFTDDGFSLYVAIFNWPLKECGLYGDLICDAFR